MIYHSSKTSYAIDIFLTLAYNVVMLICDNCNTVVKKPTFCETKCRVKWHYDQKYGIVPGKIDEKEVIGEIRRIAVSPTSTTTPSSNVNPVETPAALLKPICEAGRGLCRARSIGKYRLIADGVDEKVENLCSIHFAKAEREPGVEVKEL